MDFYVDEGLRKLIPVLSESERAQLEENLKRDGCRDPLVIWAEKGSLLDGHHRLEICRRNKIDYRIEKISLKTRDEAKAWVITNQFGRRNLAPFVRAELALQLEPLIAEKAKANIRAGGGSGISGRQKSDNPIETKRELAKVAGISHDTIHKAKVISEKASEPVKEKLRTGKTTINAAYGEIKRKEKQTKQTERDAAKLQSLPENRCQLIHGEFSQACQEIKANSVDVIITDPPYSQEFLPLYGKLAEAAPRLLKTGGSLLVMVGQSYLPEILSVMTPHIRYQWTAAYLTPGGKSVQLWQRKVNTFWKPILWFVNGEYKGDWVGDVTKSTVNDNDKRFHEWGQSESGMADVVERFSRVGDLILDPFMGAGTTGVAALKLNRQFIGIDSDAESVKQARIRMANAA